MLPNTHYTRKDKWVWARIDKGRNKWSTYNSPKHTHTVTHLHTLHIIKRRLIYRGKDIK